MKILHISDMHFGMENDGEIIESKKAVREIAMRKLEQKMEEICNKTKIDYILFTGDVAWKARENDYKNAAEWFKKILALCSLSPEHLFICPGNHDTDRNVGKLFQCPPSQKDSAELLCVESLGSLLAAYHAYEKFCSDLGVPAYAVGSKESFLVGIRETEDIRVVCINTAWLSQNKQAQKKMWVGYMFLQVIRKALMEKDSKPVITIMHHPSETWNEVESHFYDGSHNVFSEICRLSDMVFSGHTHESKGKESVCEEALVCSIGFFRNYPFLSSHIA